jgi:hypothetical protein
MEEAEEEGQGHVRRGAGSREESGGVTRERRPTSSGLSRRVVGLHVKEDRHRYREKKTRKSDRVTR